MNKIFQKYLIASDHAGYELKEYIKAEVDLPWLDLGTYSTESVDYPDFSEELVSRMEPGAMGVLVCGTGQGMAMSANKHPQVRAALCWSTASTKLSREHNDANILCLAGKLIDHKKAVKYVKTFLKTEFEGGRHGRRVDKFSEKL